MIPLRDTAFAGVKAFTLSYPEVTHLFASLELKERGVTHVPCLFTAGCGPTPHQRSGKTSIAAATKQVPTSMLRFTTTARRLAASSRRVSGEKSCIQFFTEHSYWDPPAELETLRGVTEDI